MILKLETDHGGSNWCFIDNIADINQEFCDKEKIGDRKYKIPNILEDQRIQIQEEDLGASDCAGFRGIHRVIEINKHLRYFFLLSLRIQNIGSDEYVMRHIYTDADAYLLNNDGQTIERVSGET